VQWAETPETEPGGQVELMEVELESNNNAHQHANNPPNDRGMHELADDLVVELNGCLG
jgi:hypothetical protein